VAPWYEKGGRGDAGRERRREKKEKKEEKKKKRKKKGKATAAARDARMRISRLVFQDVTEKKSRREEKRENRKKKDPPLQIDDWMSNPVSLLALLQEKEENPEDEWERK